MQENKNKTNLKNEIEKQNKELKENIVDDFLKWIEQKTILLITTRNSDKYKTAFEATKKNGSAGSILCKDLTKNCCFEFESNKVANKYNDLIGYYKREYLEANKTGGVPSIWKYFKYFIKYLNEGPDIDHTIKMTVGDGIQRVINKGAETLYASPSESSKAKRSNDEIGESRKEAYREIKILRIKT